MTITTKYGVEKFDCIRLALTQDPYRAPSMRGGCDMCDHYRAAAVYLDDADHVDGHEIVLEWYIIDPDCADESDACDWTKFTVWVNGGRAYSLKHLSYDPVQPTKTIYPISWMQVQS